MRWQLGHKSIKFVGSLFLWLRSLWCICSTPLSRSHLHLAQCGVSLTSTWRCLRSVSTPRLANDVARRAQDLLQYTFFRLRAVTTNDLLQQLQTRVVAYAACLCAAAHALEQNCRSISLGMFLKGALQTLHSVVYAVSTFPFFQPNDERAQSSEQNLDGLRNIFVHVGQCFGSSVRLCSPAQTREQQTLCGCFGSMNATPHSKHLMEVLYASH